MAKPGYKLTTGEQSFVQVVSETFSTSREGALEAFLKLKCFISGDAAFSKMHDEAALGRLDGDFESTFIRVRDRVVRLNLAAILRQVVMPLSGGYLGYATAAALGATGMAPALIGALISMMIWCHMAPGTWAMLKERMANIVEETFGRASL